MNDNLKIKDFFRAFQNLYNFVLADKTYTPVSDELSRITHGNLCRYSKDLLDALVCFRNRFEQGKPYILKDINHLNHILQSNRLNDSYSQDQIEELAHLVKEVSESYESICDFVNEQDFNGF